MVPLQEEKFHILKSRCSVDIDMLDRSAVQALYLLQSRVHLNVYLILLDIEKSIQFSL